MRRKLSLGFIRLRSLNTGIDQDRENVHRERNRSGRSLLNTQAQPSISFTNKMEEANKIVEHWVDLMGFE